MPLALVAHDYTPDALTLDEMPDRAPEAGEVLLAVRVAALNPYEAKQFAGKGDPDRSRLPLRLGTEASGEVIAVGPDPIGADGTALAVGDLVYGNRLSGAQATRVTVKADRLLRLPDGVDPAEAAGLLVVGSTAVHALTAVDVKAGETVLIHGVGGSVGEMAAQLAVLRGARVIGTASPSRTESLTRDGVTVLAYGDGLAGRVRAAAPDGIDAAIDTAGTDEALAVSLEFVADPHRIVTIANFRAAGTGIQMIGGGPGADPGSAIRAAARFELNDLLAAGRISVPIAARFPLSQAAAAYRLVASGHAGGKVVLTVD